MSQWCRAAGAFQISRSTSDREKPSDVSHKWGRTKVMTPKNVGNGLLYQAALIPKMRKVQPRPWYRRGSGTSSKGCPAGKTRSSAAAEPSCNQGPKPSGETSRPFPSPRQMHIPPWLWFRNPSEVVQSIRQPSRPSAAMVLLSFSATDSGGHH